MDIREFYEDFEEVFRVAHNAQMKNVWTAVKVMVAKDSDGHTVSLQPVIKQAVNMPDGSVSHVSLPLLGDVPVKYAGGGGTTTTHMVKEKDEGTAIICCRPIDTWHQQGGVQMQIDDRMHSLSDAVYIPGGRSTPNKLDKVSTVSHQTRSDDGKHVADLHPKNGVTHQSTNMVLASVGGSNHLVQKSSIVVNAAKHLINCG